MHNQPREPQPYEDCQAKSIQECGWTYKEWTEAGVKASRATTHRRVRNLATVVIRGVLPGLRRRRTGLLPSGPSPLFRWEQVLCFIWNQGPRVWWKGEKLITKVSWSPVLSFHSLWWLGCNVICWSWSIMFFWKPSHCHPFTKNMYSTSRFLLLTSFLKILISFSSRIWHLLTLKKAPKVG